MSTVQLLIDKAGGVAALARAVGVSHVSIIKWRHRGQVPTERIGQVATALGVSPAEVRPDLAKLLQPQQPAA